MERSRYSFFNFLTYLLYTVIIIFLTSFFIFAGFINNLLVNLLLSLPLACLFVGYVIFLIYNPKHRFHSIYALLIFFVAYLFSFGIICLSTLIPYIYWFYIQIGLVTSFSLIWLIIRLIYEIKHYKKRDEIFLTSYFVPFIVLIGYVGILFSFNYNNSPANNVYETRGLAIYNKISEEIEKEMRIEGNELYRIKYIAFNDTKDSLDVGCLSINSNYYHLYSYDYTNNVSAEDVFKTIETQTSFPSYTKRMYIIDEENTFVSTLPLIANDASVVSYINYSLIDQNYCDAIVKTITQGKTTYMTFSANINESANASVYSYDLLGNNVLRNLERA